MTNYHHVFYAPIDREDIPPNWVNYKTPDDWLNRIWQKLENNGLRTSASRGGWHQNVIKLIARNSSVTGLEFLDCELTCLEAQDIQKGVIAINKLLDLCKNNIPQLSSEEDEEYIAFLRYESDWKQVITKDKYLRAYEEAHVTNDIETFAEYGYDALVALFSFIKTLQAVLIECLEQEKCFLYFEPQF